MSVIYCEKGVPGLTRITEKGRLLKLFTGTPFLGPELIFNEKVDHGF